MSSFFFFFVFVLLLSLLPCSHSFYATVPRNKGDTLEVEVNQLSSIRTQLPYDYYFLSYCKPPVIINSSFGLGQVLGGDRIKNSVYSFKMREAQYCKVACRVKLDANSANSFKDKIDGNMILDDLPVAVALKMRNSRDEGRSKIYELGFMVGIKGRYAGNILGASSSLTREKEERHFIHNDLSFKVMYHEDPETDYTHIVGFEVTPYSINHEYKEWNGEKTKLVTCQPSTNTYIEGSNSPQGIHTDEEIVFTYDVSFEESRWDSYLYLGDDPIHWFAMVNSLITVLFLSGVVAMVVMRTLFKDITNYNQLETQVEETGWKLVHGDVFRPPINANILCVFVANGVQVFGTVLFTITLALLGFLSPSNQGGEIKAMVLLWLFMALFGGYYSAHLYKMFKGIQWKKIALKTAFMFPATFFGIFFMLNVFIWWEESFAAVPFGTMFSMLLLWFGISVPLEFVGSYLGFKQQAIEDPVNTNEIARQIPVRAWYNIKMVLSVLIGGILQFGVVFVEFFFMWTSIWMNKFYYSFGFLLIVFVILLVTCCEIVILLCYFQLRSEDYHWRWRAYLTAGSSSLYMFAYSIFLFFTTLWIEKFVSVILYFGYMLIASFAFFVLTGTIGFYACFWFVRKIYSSVKFD
ncbi:putative nonaspanin (TM9SF) [Rosa chinensis]|uniref:Transmembrane 9 superfamily member n=1 Tax=Rosa chinensis TaxID=74649 RepID=A0A2P6RK94_ROSCH|nr:putative nonaspanin (TM9SF) [Rosa chinensis]